MCIMIAYGAAHNDHSMRLDIGIKVVWWDANLMEMMYKSHPNPNSDPYTEASFLTTREAGRSCLRATTVLFEVELNSEPTNQLKHVVQLSQRI